MSINLDKFKYDLVEGWREVMDSKNPIDWAVFGYDGQSFDLKLASKGTGGLDEMVDNFNSGRIMYGLCRVKLKDRNVEKIVLVNWQGEGAPLARKGTCANHVSTVKTFFKGVHVTINARTDEDVDPNVILESVAKATSAGVCMSSSIEMDSKTEPVGAVYKRVNPQEEINAQAKDAFWAKEEAEEESRKKVEKNRLSKFSQNEVKLLRKESQDYFDQEQLEKTMSPVPASPIPNIPISTNGDTSLNNGNGTRESTSPTSSSPLISNAFMATEKAAVLKASIPRKNPSENLVRQRIKSFDGNPNESLLSFNQPTTNGGVRSGSKSPADGETLSVMKRKQMFESGIVSNTSQSIVRKDPALEIKALQEESLKSAASVAPTSTHEESHKSAASVAHASLDSRVKSPPPPSAAAVPPPVQKTNPAVTAKAPNQVKAYNLPFHIGGGVSSRLAEKVNKVASGETNGVNGNSLSSVESSSTASSSASKSSVLTQPASLAVGTTGIKAEFSAAPIPQHITTNFELPKSNSENPPVAERERVPVKPPSPRPPSTDGGFKKQENISEEIGDTTVQSAEPIIPKTPSPVPTVVKEQKEIIVPAPNGTSFVIKPEMGLCARAIYDYQAADESEITFDPGEIITNIETIDEGWWEGMGPSGLYGLFPSNYVELLN